MEYTRYTLNKERLKLDQKRKELLADYYFYRDMNKYLSPEDRNKETDRIKARMDNLKDHIDEIDFLLDLLDKAGIDEIYKKHRKREVFVYEPSISG